MAACWGVSLQDESLEKLMADPTQIHRLFNNPNVKAIVPNFANQIADLPVRRLQHHI